MIIGWRASEFPRVTNQHLRIVTIVDQSSGNTFFLVIDLLPVVWTKQIKYNKYNDHYDIPVMREKYQYIQVIDTSSTNKLIC